MKQEWLTRLLGTQWNGSGELWLDPEGNSADRCECTLRIKNEALLYKWSYEGQKQEGNFTFDEGGAVWLDSWHQPTATKCTNVADAMGLFTIEHSYEVPSSPRWGWRSKLSERPNGDLVLQMFNLAPWGEEGRAVRMIFKRVQ